MNTTLRFWSILFVLFAAVAGETIRSLDRAGVAVARSHDTPRSSPAAIP